MMYVVPHGDQLDEYDLPADATASPGALATLYGLRQFGASALGIGILATALHYLGFGPQEPEPEAETGGAAPAAPDAEDAP